MGLWPVFGPSYRDYPFPMDPSARAWESVVICLVAHCPEPRPRASVRVGFAWPPSSSEARSRLAQSGLRGLSRMQPIRRQGVAGSRPRVIVARASLHTIAIDSVWPWQTQVAPGATQQKRMRSCDADSFPLTWTACRGFRTDSVGSCRTSSNIGAPRPKGGKSWSMVRAQPWRQYNRALVLLRPSSELIAG
jgi:hypothetical protein